MRTRVIAALSMILIAAASSAQTPMEPTPTPVIGQLLVNPSFESPATGQGQPEGWIAYNANGILAETEYALIDPPVDSYPDGNQIVRAFGTNQSTLNRTAGWRQTVQVVPGERYALSGYVQTGKAYVNWPDREPYRQGMARIGADQNGVSHTSTAVDVWCATPEQRDSMAGWQKSDGVWTRISAEFTALSDYTTIFVEGDMLLPSEWCGAYMDNVTLIGPIPPPSTLTPTPYPTATPTPSPPPYQGHLTRTWVKAPSPPGEFRRTAAVLLNFKDQLWLLGGRNNFSESRGDILSSTDGLTWTEVTPLAPWGKRGDHAGAVFGGRMWVFGGILGNSYSVANDVWSSTDGTHWTEMTGNAPWGARYGHAVAAHGGALYLIGGYSFRDIYYNDVWRSTDGVQWTRVREHAPWFARRDHVVLSFQGKLWLLGGRAWNDIWCSDDGDLWTLIHFQAPWPWRHSHAGFVHDNRMWIIGGLGAGLNHFSDTWVSDDGVRWVRSSWASWPGRMDHTAALLGRRLVLMGGNTALDYLGVFDDLWYSDDLMTVAPSLHLR